VLSASTTVGVVAAVVLAGCCIASSPGAPLTGVELGTTSSYFGFRVCATQTLHDCRGSATTRLGVRAYPVVDIEPTAACTTLEATTVAACPGPPSAPATLRCYAGHGVLYDLMAGPGTSTLEAPSSRFTLQCSEGNASIDFIEPF
jgi:hypothetical protein